MKFNTVIIGGGLAGLAAGIRLSGKGQRCAIISQGQSALHFSSGSFDLVNTEFLGQKDMSNRDALERIAAEKPGHPYSIIGSDLCMEYAEQVPEMFRNAGLNTTGNAARNHYRITPMGKSRQTWLTLDGYLTSEKEDSLGFRRTAIINVEGFLDFYPDFIADEFRKCGTESVCRTINLPDIDAVRRNPSEMRSANLARVFDKDSNLEALADRIKECSEGCDAAILPAIIGLDRTDSLEKIREKCRIPVMLLPTLPPSIPGVHAQQSLVKHFRKLGGEYFLGDTVLRADMDGHRVLRIYTQNHTDMYFEADNFMLATGSFFSKGIIATPDKVYEPVFGADTSYLPERAGWYSRKFFDRHAYQSFGIIADRSLRVIKDGEPVSNLYAAGAGLAGFNPIEEGCGAGVSLLTAFHAAENIYKNQQP